jgi:hypothetical protein
VVGLGFVPSALAVSGGRVWLVGGANGPGPSRVQLAFIDSPTDPLVKEIHAQTFLATSSRPAEALAPFGRAAESVLLVAPSEPRPAAALQAPVAEPLTLTFTGVDAGMRLAPSAVSGKRLLAKSTTAATFALIDNAGTADAAVGAVASYDADGAGTQQTFAQSADGVVFWATGVNQFGLQPSTRAARGYFLLASETASFDPARAGVDVEVYPTDVPANAAVFGPSAATAAMVDSNTAMIAAQAREDASQTSVQFVTRAPLGLLKDGPTPRRALLPTPVSSVLAAAGHGGVGYLVVDAPGPAVGAIVVVFDSACAP